MLIFLAKATEVCLNLKVSDSNPLSFCQIFPPRIVFYVKWTLSCSGWLAYWHCLQKKEVHSEHPYTHHQDSTINFFALLYVYL